MGHLVGNTITTLDQDHPQDTLYHVMDQVHRIIAIAMAWLSSYDHHHAGTRLAHPRVKESEAVAVCTMEECMTDPVMLIIPDAFTINLGLDLVCPGCGTAVVILKRGVTSGVDRLIDSYIVTRSADTLDDIRKMKGEVQVKSS